MIIVGLDLSLTSTGVARLDVGAGTPTIKLDTITSKSPTTRRGPKGEALPATLDQRHTRLHNLRLNICLQAHAADLVIIEGPSYGSKTGHQHDRSGLWWIVTDWLMQPEDGDGWGKTVIEVSPSSRMKYATGKGMASKDAVMLAAANRYRHLVEVTGNDVADALLLAAMAARHLGHPIESSLPQTHLAAMDGVHWPTTTR
jgi:crossover junction endodeoxyribonuclease RuvC